MVVNPADVPTKDKEKATKTDRVDCRKLARSLRNGELEAIYVPSRIKGEDRSLVRTRQSMVRKQTRCKNQIKSILSFYGIPVPEDMETRRWSRRFISFIEQIRMEKTSGDFALKAHLDELLYLRQIIARLNKAIAQLAKTGEYHPHVQLLKTVPGISTLTAMILLTELSEISRFKTLDKLASYVGLIPNTNVSGEQDHKTTLTKRRNSQLRALLIESSWVAVRKDPALMLAFNRLSTRMKKTKAIIPIARKLLNRIRYVLKNFHSHRLTLFFFRFVSFTVVPSIIPLPRYPLSQYASFGCQPAIFVACSYRGLQGMPIVGVPVDCINPQNPIPL